MRKFKEWCKQERVNRPEKDTSQDMFPTNGDALFANFYMVFAISLAVVILMLSK